MDTASKIQTKEIDPIVFRKDKPGDDGDDECSLKDFSPQEEENPEAKVEPKDSGDGTSVDSDLAGQYPTNL